MSEMKGELIVERKKETKEQEMRRLVADVLTSLCALLLKINKVIVAKNKQSFLLHLLTFRTR